MPRYDIIYKNLNSVSFIFVAIIGSIHFLNGLLLANNINVKQSWLLTRLLDLPFLIVTILYFMSLIRLKIANKEFTKIELADVILWIISIIIILAFQTFDVFFSNTLPL